MVFIKQAKRNRSAKKDKFQDDKLIQLMRQIGYEFDSEGRMIKHPMDKRRKENERKWI